MPAFGFNPAEVEAQDNPFEPVPAGDYKLALVEAEEKLTNDNSGSYINFKFQIIEGQYQNRYLFDMAMIKSARTDEKMQKALQIAREKIASICRSAGKPSAQRTEDLYQIPVMASIKVKTDPEHGKKNEIKSYASAGVAQPPVGNSFGQPQAQTPAQNGQAAAARNQTASPSNAPVEPWKRGAA